MGRETESCNERRGRDKAEEITREALDIKREMMAPGNSYKSLRPFFLLVWNEDYEEVGIPGIKAYAEEKKICLMLSVRPNLVEEDPPEGSPGW